MLPHKKLRNEVNQNIHLEIKMKVSCEYTYFKTTIAINR